MDKTKGFLVTWQHMIQDEGIFMWTKEMFGTDVYHLVAAFIIYSMLGWLVESIYMSICNKKLTNRGFGKGPFCPIYGFGAVIGYLVLRPLSNNPLLLYCVGAVMATVFEYLVGRLMLKIFGEVWWDYTNKPCNFQGLICLESTIAWGFYAIIIITFLHGKVMGIIDRYDMQLGKRFCVIVLCIVTIDYLFQFAKLFGADMKKSRERITELYESIRTKW
ncbi:MAG: putative ABC transporter permease [Lachnospiraceae bacterium]|nr:putative ABC transporter permease [Lachnospiraceae bacterium]